jgi:hypothetical protein
MKSIGGRKLFVLAGSVAGLFIAGGIVYATIPDGGGVIHGCYGPSGKLRVIDTDAGESCNGSETAVTWNQTGPQGPQGLPGSPGATGPAGPQGPAGPAHVVTVWNGVQVEAAPGSKVQVTAACPAGMVVLGGGGQTNDPTVVDPSKTSIDTSRPDPYYSGSPTGWFVSGHRNADVGVGQIQVVASVICGG